MDEKMRKELQNTVKIPRNVEEKMQDSYRQIYQGVVQMKPAEHRRIPGWAKAAAAAVCIMFAGTTVLVSNPALAKDLPIIGNIFERMIEAREANPYGNKDTVAYDKIKENAQPASDIAESNGVEIGVSEAYCDGYSLYFTLSVCTEDEALNAAETVLLERMTEDGSLQPYWVEINGEFVGLNSGFTKSEDGLFVGVAVIEKYYLKDKEFPEQMNVTVGVDSVTGSYYGDTSKAPVTIEGEWNLAFDVTKDESSNKVIDVSAESNGFAVKKVVQTPSNFHIDFVVPAEWVEQNPEIIVLDANGNAVQKWGATMVDQEDGSQLREYTLEQSDSNSYTIQVIDKNNSQEELIVLEEFQITL